MTCQRCQGLMCPADLRDWGSSASEDCSNAFRCLACGAIEDPVIRSNRTRATPIKSRRKWNRRSASFAYADAEMAGMALGKKASLDSDW
jgi:hypothetical protein